MYSMTEEARQLDSNEHISGSRRKWRGMVLTLLMLLVGGFASEAWAVDVTVNYVIVALDGSRALTIKNQSATVGADLRMSTQLAKYKSPMVLDSEYSFYTTFANAQARTSAITTVPATVPGDTIYVRYTFEPANASRIGLTDGALYNIRRVGDAAKTGGSTSYLVQDNYSTDICAYFSAGNKASLYTGEQSLRTGRFMWKLNVKDPYQLTIQTQRADDKNYADWYLSATGAGDGFKNIRQVQTLATAQKNKVWAYGIVPGDADGAYKLIVCDNATGLVSAGLDEQGHGYLNNARSERLDYAGWSNHTGSNKVADYSDLEFKAVNVYHIINKAGRKALSLAAGTLTTLAVPDELKTPYITSDASYKFFDTQEHAQAYSRDGSTTGEITTVGEIQGTSVYIGYQWDGTVPSGLPRLDGTSWHQVLSDSGNKYFITSGATHTSTTNTATVGTDYPYLWSFMGGDPYDIILANLAANESNGSTYQLALSDNYKAYDTQYGWYRLRMSASGGFSTMIVNSGTAGRYNLITLSSDGFVGTENYVRALWSNNNDVLFIRLGASYKNNSDARYRFQFPEVPIAQVKFHLTTQLGGVELTAMQTVVDYASVTIALPENLRRKYCSYTFYPTPADADAGTNPLTTYDDVVANCTPEDGVYQVYVKYAVGVLPFERSTDYATAHWYRMTAEGAAYTRWSGSQLVAGGDGLSNTVYTHDYQYAFEGDPYELRLMNREGGEGNYLGVSASPNNGDDITPRSSGMLTWEIVDDGTTSNTFQLRAFGTAGTATPYYAGYTSGAAKYYISAMTMGVEELPERTYTYYIVDNTGRLAISAEVSQRVTTPITFQSLPATIRSPYIEDEELTAYLAKTSLGVSYSRTTYSLSSLTDETPITAEGSNTDIYIRYTTDHLQEKTLRINGKRSYNVVRVSGSEYVHSVSESAVGYNSSATLDNKRDKAYLWSMAGNDPYAVLLQNTQQAGKYFTINTSSYPPAFSLGSVSGTSSANTFFILMAGSSSDETQVKLMAATGTSITGAEELRFENNLPTAHYYIIDRQHKVVIDAEASGDASDLEVPVSIQSPLVSRYHYWKFQSLSANANGSGTPNVLDADATYYVKGGETEITSIGEALGGGDIHIYCTYDVADEDMFANAKHYRAKGYDEGKEEVDDGNGNKVNTNATAPMYLLKFLHGESFYQEDGHDALMGTAQKAVYPYNNGDAGLYVYGQEQWETQLESAATTRGRWPWYLESETLDPYHVYVSSRQSQAGSYSYLRTYKPQDYSEIVTGVITLADTVKLSSKNPDKYTRQKPTEYMILGTTGHGRFVTVEKVAIDLNSDGDTEDSDENERRTVTSFEQYWKNNPTANNLLEAAGKGRVTANEESVSLTSAQQNYLENTDIARRKGEWHQYKAWANSAPWTKRTDGTTNKKYEYKDHWFQTISMGDGEFALEETSLSAVLVLLDQHGWEIVRLNLPNGPDDPMRAERYAAMQKYSSPMVKAYHYWKTGSKVPGYHKFKVSDYAVDENEQEYTSAKLGFLEPDEDGVYRGLLPNYELQGKVGNMSRDWYVTYEVKDEYADSYRAAATEGATQASAFMLGQGNGTTTLWATTTDGNDITTDVTPTEYDDISDQMLWYLHPNFNIDREMGYLYKGQAGAQDDALTKVETDAENYANGVNGFDPYNVQIQNKAYQNKYITTNAASAALVAGLWQGPESGTITIGLQTLDVRFTAMGHDQKTIQGSNATFMVVDDGHGNMRLMPRFDHNRVVQALSTVVAQAAAAATGDKKGVQTTLLTHPTEYTYHVVNKNGREAITYKKQYFSPDAFSPDEHFPDELRAYGAKNFRYYPLSEFDPDPLSRGVYRLVSGTPASLDTYAVFGNKGDVFVMYDLDDSKLLSSLYNLKLNDTNFLHYDASGNTTSATATSLDTDETKDQENIWRIATNNGDPYDVRLYNFRQPDIPMSVATLGTSPTATENQTYQTFILTAQDAANMKFRLLATHSESATSDLTPYAYLGLSGTTPQVLTTSPQWFKLYPVTLGFTYKLYDLAGNLTLQSTVSDVTDMTPALPQVMKSPLVKQYYYYRDEAQAIPITSLASTVDNIVYVGYEPYPLEEASLKLDGSEPYTLFDKDHPSNLYALNNGTTGDVRRQSSIYLREPYYRWYLTARQVDGKYDPYDVTLTTGYNNYAWSNNMVEYVNEATTTGSHNLSLQPTTSHRYMIMTGVKEDGIQYVEILQKKVDSKGYRPNCTNRYQYVYYNNDGRLNAGQGASYVHENANMQFRFQPAYTYHVLNLQGKEAVSTIVGRMLKSDTELELEDVIKSPLVDTYHYYDATSFDVSADGVYTLKSTAKELTLLSEAKTVDIYVTYGKHEINNLIDLNGQTAYNMITGTPASGTHGSYTWYDAEARSLKGTNQYYRNGAYVTDANPDAEAQKTRPYLWRFFGGDPYALTIQNALYTDRYIYRGNGVNQYGSVLNLGTTNDENFRTFILTGTKDDTSTTEDDDFKFQIMGSGIYSQTNNTYKCKFQYLGRNVTDNPHRNHTGIELWGFEFGWGDFIYGTSIVRVKLQPQNQGKITYIVLNKRGDEAVHYRVDATQKLPPELPAAIKSPYAKNFKYYTSDAKTTEIISDNADTYMVDGAEVYVTYDADTDALADAALDLTGSDSYNLWTNGVYLYNASAADDDKIVTDASPARYDDTMHEWYLVGNGNPENVLDPYNVHLKSKQKPTKYIEMATYDPDMPGNTLSSIIAHSDGNEVPAFILMDGQPGNLELLAATGAKTNQAAADDEIDNRLMYLGYYAEPQLMGPGSDPLHPVNRSGMNQVQIRLKQPLSGVVYHIINLNNVEVVQYTVAASKGDALAVPEPIRSPFATQWNYYSDAACTQSLSAVPSAGSDIYVTYVYDDATATHLQLDGQRFYNLSVANGYIQENEGSISVLEQTTLSSEEANVAANLWAFDGQTASKGIDPYGLNLLNKPYNDIVAGAALSYVSDTGNPMQMSDGETENFHSTFFLVGSDPAGPYEMVLASGQNITNNVLAYVSRQEETTVSLTRDAAYQHENAALQIRLTSPVNLYLYKVQDRSGNVAIQAWGEGVAGAIPEIPSVIKSPLVSRFYYDVESLPYTTGEDEVVVTYDVDDETTLQPYLNGAKLYNLMLRDSCYMKSSGTDVSLEQDTKQSNLGTPATVVGGGNDPYIWKPSANMGDGRLDPYAIILRHSNDNVLCSSSSSLSLGTNDIVLATTPGAGTYQKFILLEGSDGRYQFMAATGEDLDSKPDQNLFAYLGVTGDNQAKLLIGNTYAQDRAAIQMELVPFQYTYTYVVVNNNRYEAIRNESVHDAGDPVSLPLGLNSPLIDANKYTYYTPEAFTTTGDWGTTRFEYAADSASHTISTLPYNNQTIYVRYKYTPTAGGLDIGNTGEAPKVKYQVGYITSDMQRYLYANTAGNVKDIYTASAPSSNANYLWKLDGNGDPYDVRIINMHDNRSGDVLDLREVWWYSKNGNTSLSWSGRAPYPHMYPEEGDPVTYTVAVDGENNVTGTNKTTRFAIVEHPDGGYRLMLIAPFTWHDELDGVDRGNTNFGTYFLFNLSSNRFTSISTSSSTPESGDPIYFIPATTHNYRFHLTTKIEERTLVVDKEKQMVRDLFSLPEELQRKYCTYTYKYYTTDADEDHREPVEKGTLGAVEREVEADNFGITYYPYFPAIDGDNSKWVDIYVDYEVIPKGEPNGIPFNLMTSDRARTQALFDPSSGILDVAFDLTSYDKMVETLSWTGLRRCDYLYFMVLKTNNDYSNNNGQYFLRRESNGRISWLNNDFRLYQDSEKNYNKWPYARCAEAYRENDHDPFQEKRWLWSFAGDPYDLYIFNTSAAVEETYNAITGETTFNTHRDHLVSYQTLVSTSGTTTEHMVNTPGYEELAPRRYLWGLAEGQGANSSQTFSLITSEFQYDEEDDVYRNPAIPNIEEKPLYWRMDKSVVEGATEVMLQPRAQTNTTLDYNLQVLPFEPTKFVDLRFIVRRDDEVGKTTDDKSKGTYLGNYPVSVADSISSGLILPGDAAAKSQASSQFIDRLSSGTVRMFYELTDRMFAAGDVIDTEHPETLPLELRRQFCNYTVYTDDYRSTGDYTVSGDYFRGTPQTDPVTGDPIYNEAGMLMYNFFKYQRDGSGNLILLPSGDPLVVGTAPQTIYVKYEVTTDKFLKKRPTKEEVDEMLANNDHVYFMDFANPNLMKGQKLGYNTGHHTYYDEKTTFEGQIGRLYGGLSAEKRIWDGTQFVDDTNQRFNYCHYRTTTNRMESVPENLKWYFVGDPYKLQVYCTHDEFNKETVRLDGEDCTPGTVPSNLCRFDPTESNFQFVVDCVHFRTPDENFIDERRTLDYIDADGNNITVENANYGKPYYDNFYWEVVPTTTDDKEAFALRFRADNQILGYRNVFYYLAHDGLKRTYREARSDNPKAYNINLSYDENNTRHLSGRYVGYHQANDVNCVIRLTQPTKIYFTAYKETYGGQPVVKEELSEYFGLGETLTEVPRHLQRKFVKYGNLEYQTSSPDTWHTASFPFTMYNDSAYNLENCNLVDPVHTIANEWVHQEGAYGENLAVTGNYTKTRASFKFRVTYEVDDMTKDGIHLFTTPAEFANASVQPQWLDVTVGGNNWMYYDKANLDAEKMENDTLRVSRYPTSAIAEQANSGWGTGLKGLHWAFIGDPYKFNIINRRRWEDVGSPRTEVDGSNFWLGTDYGQHNQLEGGVYKYYNYTQLGDTKENNAYNSDDTENGNTEWSLMMCKTGGTSDYFLRTASLKTTSVDDLVGDYSNDHAPSNMTNNYARIVRKDFTNLDGSADPQKSAYVLETFSLDTKTNEIHKAEIRTAVAKDEDGANNDCFDATVHIYNTAGELKATLKHVEVVYGDVVNSLPKTLKRYGCNYIECYQIYHLGYTEEMLKDPTSAATVARTEYIKNTVANLNNFTGANLMGSIKTFSDATLDRSKVITDINGRKYIEVAYVYEVEDDVARFFTSVEDAQQDNYYWSNAYYQWDQTYKGTNVRVVTYENVFDHYEYNSDGHIVNEVYKQVEKVEYRSGEEISTPAYGWLNSHVGVSQAYGDETTQSEDNRQKWSFVGDPYDFELKNYSQYLENSHSAFTYAKNNDLNRNELNASDTQNSHWAIVQGLQKTAVVNGKTVKVVDEEGNPVYVYYLALIDDETGLATDFVTFDRAAENRDLPSSEQNLFMKGSPLEDDPTGNFYNNATKEVRPFYLADLQSYANWVVYHLVIAHQHSLDYTDDFDTELTTAAQRTEAKRIIDQHLVEWLKYNYPSYMQTTTVSDGTRNYTKVTEQFLPTYVATGEGKVTADQPLKGQLKTSTITEIEKLLKTASLRDVVNDSISDYSVQRVGIGNTLTVPWYMKRQFCNYKLYQRDVLRSVTSTRPAYEEDGVTQKTFIDPETGEEKPAYEVDWVSVTEEPEARDYATVVAENGNLITKLNASHRNRMVVVDVVYTINDDEFRFSDKGRNTTAWYSMLTQNDNDGLMNFSYREGIGARHGREVHYTNNYLWAPEGDPYGFVMHSRYATVNGTGWDDVVVTTAGKLPTAVDAVKDKVGTIDYATAYSPGETLDKADSDGAVYTGYYGNIRYLHDRITHPGRGTLRPTWGARNAVYEMFAGNYERTFLMHPTSAYVDVSGDKFGSFYMVHNTSRHGAELHYYNDAKTIRSDKDANWRMMTTPEQLLPYFSRSGYVGGLEPDIANRFENQSLYSTLRYYKDNYRTNPLVIDFKTIDSARELVYGGKFYKNGGAELDYTDRRPTEADDLPLTFVSNNLKPLQQGYYRIVAFSRDALDKDAEDLDGTGITGIQGPRYISGYRFKSEREFEGYVDDDENDATPMKLKAGSRCLHFIETDEEHTTLKTFEELNAKIRSLEGSSHYERDIEPHPAMRGNIEILPAEYDPSSIFYFQPTGDKYNRFRFGTQGLQVVGTVGQTRLDDMGTGTDFRMDDIGGTAVTMRVLAATPSDADSDHTWDSDVTSGVAQNLQTHYLCIDPTHRYRITVNANNEMKEIGDSYGATTEDYWKLSDINYGIQDTKWLLQPVGTQTEWPYNEKPLSVRVNKGGHKPDPSTGYGLAGTENEDNNYYASLYVPFDSRLSKTIDAAFTNTNEAPSPKALTLKSVSQLNNMDNPQFIPAGWPVILRTSQPVTSITKEDGSMMKTDPHVDLYLPNPTPTSIPENYAKINLYGQYLEQELTSDVITAQTNDVCKAEAIRRTIAADHQFVMVVGLPFAEEGTNNMYGDANYSRDFYAYKTADAVGFYANKNWQRGYYDASSKENNGVGTAELFEALSQSEQSVRIQSHWATARKATSEQRENKYVYHNRAYFVHDYEPSSPGVKEDDFFFFLFDDVEQPAMEDGLLPLVPRWGVYDLSGRLVRSREAVLNGTWRRNLPPGMYIVNGRKMPVR